LVKSHLSRPKTRATRAARRSNNQDAHGNAIRNSILLSLSAEEAKEMIPKLEFVELPLRFLLCEIREPIRFAYFVNGGLGSVLSVMSDGKIVEVGLVGKEGFTGVPLIVGLRSSPTRILMQIAGGGFRIPADELPAVLSRCPQLEKQLLRYSQDLAMQGTQVAACNRLHSVEARLARWLLMSVDRIGGDVVPLTQEFLGHMLGTRRASVTVAAAVLHKARLIGYTRGRVTIKNRSALERAACECYGNLKRQTKAWNREQL
jgi:CRP-like cAMP-binding protein